MHWLWLWICQPPSCFVDDHGGIRPPRLSLMVGTPQRSVDATADHDAGPVASFRNAECGMRWWVAGETLLADVAPLPLPEVSHYISNHPALELSIEGRTPARTGHQRHAE